MSAPGLFSDTALSTPRLRTEVPGPRSRALHERRQRVVPRGVGSVLPVYIEHADGPWVTDVDGNRFLDLGSVFGVMKQDQGLLQRFEVVDAEHDDRRTAVARDRHGVMRRVDRFHQLGQPVLRFTHGDRLHRETLA